MMPLQELKNNLGHWIETICGASTYQELERLKADLLGKSGVVTSAFKLLKNASNDKKKEYGETLNELKESLEMAISRQKKEIG